MKFKNCMLTAGMLCISMCLSGCFASNYTTEYKETKCAEFTNEATAWFATNLPDATDVTYNSVTNSYITDAVKGSFTLDSKSYDYVWVAGTDLLYTNRLCDGTDYSVCDDRFENIVEEMFHEDSVDVTISGSSWTVPCTYYGDVIVSESGTVTSGETVTDGTVAFSYFEWGTTQDEMWVWCKDVLLRKFDSDISLAVTITYSNYSDIEGELKSKTCMNIYPGIDRMVFRMPDSTDYYTILRTDDGLVSEYHHKVETDKGYEWIVEEV